MSYYLKDFDYSLKDIINLEWNNIDNIWFTFSKRRIIASIVYNCDDENQHLLFEEKIEGNDYYLFHEDPLDNYESYLYTKVHFEIPEDYRKEIHEHFKKYGDIRRKTKKQHKININREKNIKDNDEIKENKEKENKEKENKEKQRKISF